MPSLCYRKAPTTRAFQNRRLWPIISEMRTLFLNLRRPMSPSLRRTGINSVHQWVFSVFISLTRRISSCLQTWLRVTVFPKKVTSDFVCIIRAIMHSSWTYSVLVKSIFKGCRFVMITNQMTYTRNMFATFPHFSVGRKLLIVTK